jgi:hypothetical protein
MLARRIRQLAKGADANEIQQMHREWKMMLFLRDSN